MKKDTTWTSCITDFNKLDVYNSGYDVEAEVLFDVVGIKFDVVCWFAYDDTLKAYELNQKNYTIHVWKTPSERICVWDTDKNEGTSDTIWDELISGAIEQYFYEKPNIID